VPVVVERPVVVETREALRRPDRVATQLGATGALGISAVALSYGSEEAMERQKAFMENRKPDFRKFRR